MARLHGLGQIEVNGKDSLVEFGLHVITASRKDLNYAGLTADEE
jgi:hypothetical protein